MTDEPFGCWAEGVVGTWRLQVIDQGGEVVEVRLLNDLGLALDTAEAVSEEEEKKTKAKSMDE